MARASAGCEKEIFRNKNQIVNYILSAISKNTHRKVGTETEFFYLSHNKHSAITLADGQRAFHEFASSFEHRGYHVKTHAENCADYPTITAIDIENFGSISLETSHGFEYATDICANAAEVRHKNTVFIEAAHSVGRKIGYEPVFRGYVPQYSAAVPVSRSRSLLSRQCLRDRFGAGADLLSRRQGAFASFQVNLDACGDAFHEVYRTLLLAEPLFSLRYGDRSGRPHLKHEAYSPLIPEQTEPITGVWSARNNPQAVEIIVDRLLQVRIPFLPDPSNHDIYKAEPLDALKRPPSVADLTAAERLTEKVLKNALSFLFMSPSLRRPAVLEVRGIDTQGNPKRIGKITERHTNLVYDDEKRQNLLAAYDHFNEHDIAALHKAAVHPDLHEALSTRIKGQPVALIMRDIMERSRPQKITVETNPASSLAQLLSKSAEGAPMPALS